MFFFYCFPWDGVQKIPMNIGNNKIIINVFLLLNVYYEWYINSDYNRSVNDDLRLEGVTSPIKRTFLIILMLRTNEYLQGGAKFTVADLKWLLFIKYFFENLSIYFYWFLHFSGRNFRFTTSDSIINLKNKIVRFSEREIKKRFWTYENRLIYTKLLRLWTKLQ